MQALLERSIFTLTRNDDWLRVITSPCFTKPAMVLTTDFYLQRDQQFTTEPDHHVNTQFRLQEIGVELARFTYVHRVHSPVAQSEDRGELSLLYRQRPAFFPDIAAAHSVALEALRKSGVALTDVDPDRSTVHLDRTTCAQWSIRIPRRAPDTDQ